MKIAIKSVLVVLILVGLGGAGRLLFAQGLDDIRPDGVKLRGDGSVDDTQPDLPDAPDAPDLPDAPDAPDAVDRPDGPDDDITIFKQDDRTRQADGTRTRNRNDVSVDPLTGIQRDRTRTRVRNPDGSEIRTERRVFTDANGNFIGERVRNRERPARAERGDRAERAARADRPERPERANRPERAERPERANRPERAERPERANRPERAERADRPERAERGERAARPERAERADRAER